MPANERSPIERTAYVRADRRIRSRVVDHLQQVGALKRGQVLSTLESARPIGGAVLARGYLVIGVEPNEANATGRRSTTCARM